MDKEIVRFTAVRSFLFAPYSESHHQAMPIAPHHYATDAQSNRKVRPGFRSEGIFYPCSAMVYRCKLCSDDVGYPLLFGFIFVDWGPDMRRFFAIVPFLIQLTAFSQDLIVANFSGPVNLDRYEEFPFEITVQNIGIVSTSKGVYSAAYLSTDDQWDGSDLPIASTLVEALAPGQSLTGTPYRPMIDASPGTYYLIIKTDHLGQISETDETNNLLVIPNFVVNQPDVDFTFTSFSLDKSMYTRTGQVKLSYVLENLGLTNTGGVIEIQFSLSLDDKFDPDDIRLEVASGVLTGPDKLESRKNQFLTLSAPHNGNYYILAKVDHNHFDNERFDETNEDNNFFAVPIVIQPGADLVLSGASATFSSGEVHTTIHLSNDGWAAAEGYSIGWRLSKNPKPVGPFVSCSSNSYTWSPGTGGLHNISIPVHDVAPGTYYAEFKLNYDYVVEETNYANNTYTVSTPIVIESPAPNVKINLISIDPVYDNNDQLKVKLNLTNTGNTVGYTQTYKLTFYDGEFEILFTENASVSIDFDPGATVNKLVNITLPTSLATGTHYVILSCVGTCYTSPSRDLGIEFDVFTRQYSLTGIVQGEDGIPITQGKLFLYQTDDTGNTKSVQTIVPYNGQSFSFLIDTNPHTLYFVPDPVLYPDYVPTVFGKTVALEEGNFFTTSADLDVTLEVLKVNPSETGTGIINGQVTSGNPSGRMRTQPSALLTTIIPVILISSTDEVVGITYTDESGSYEFKDLPRAFYKVMLGFELDDPRLSAPHFVDISSKNMKVDFNLTAEGVVTESSQLFLSQAITFDEFPACQYGYPSIIPDAESDTGLPVEYFSSDNSIAMIENGEIVIKGVGTVTITASQAGNDFYHPAHVDRTLAIDKANQSISLSPLTKMTYSDKPFSVQSLSSSGLAVSLSSSDPDIASVNGDQITIHGAGMVEIIGEQPGNEYYNEAVAVREWLIIEKATQSILFDAIPEQSTEAASFTLSAEASSGLQVSFESSDESVVSINGNVATIHQSGTVTIAARQQGNQNYLSAEEISQPVTIHLVLGIEEQNVVKHVFPNPTTDYVTVQIGKLTNVEVFDSMGRIRNEVTWLDDTIDLTRTEPGVYLMKLVSGDQASVIRIVKK